MLRSGSPGLGPAAERRERVFQLAAVATAGPPNHKADGPRQPPPKSERAERTRRAAGPDVRARIADARAPRLSPPIQPVWSDLPAAAAPNRRTPKLRRAAATCAITPGRVVGLRPRATLTASAAACRWCDGRRGPRTRSPPRRTIAGSDANVQPPVSDPAEQLVGAGHQIVPRDDVVGQRRAGEIQRAAGHQSHHSNAGRGRSPRRTAPSGGDAEEP